MEQEIIISLNFDITCPTPYAYFIIFMRVADDIPSKHCVIVRVVFIQLFNLNFHFSFIR